MTIVNLLLQLYVEAYDSAYPSARQLAEVTVTVLRNTNAPIFSPSSYDTSISERYPIGEQVLRVTATDDDRVSARLLQSWRRCVPIRPYITIRTRRSIVRLHSACVRDRVVARMCSSTR